MMLANNDQAPDTEMISRFAGILFEYAEGYVTARILPEKGAGDGKAWSRTLPADERLGDALGALAAKAAGNRRALYVVPGTTSREGRAGAADIAETGVVIVDLDEGDIEGKRKHLEDHLGRASLLVASGGLTEGGQKKLHLYWRLTEAARDEDLALVGKLQGDIAQRVGGDTSFAKVCQPIRVAGSLHQKYGQVARCTIVDETGTEHDLHDFAERVALLPEFGGLAAVSKEAVRDCVAPSVSDLLNRIVREGGIDGITRFDALSKVMGFHIRQIRLGRTTREQAWDQVRDYNATRISPPWSEPKLASEFSRLVDRDIRNHGTSDQVWGKQTSAEGADAPELSDDALAAMFVARHGSDWHYVTAWGQWLRWTGTHWARDETAEITELIRGVCRKASRLAKTPREARQVASQKTIRAVRQVSSADRAVAARTSDWDRDAMLLNTSGGIVDLRTGEQMPHDRDRLMTQIAAASVGSDCPRWQTFLEEVTDNDRDLIAYLGRLCGYCLTGATSEQAFFFLHGDGANGKSVFLRVLSSVLGTYAACAPFETFTASRSDRHPTDLAGLRGQRLVTVGETEQGRVWAESRIKSITGGEPIRARFMNRDYFEFVPRFKLVVAGNHRPRLSSVGEAMRRRLHLVPFEVTIPPDKRDLGLPERLDQELDGILGWMIRGCADWQKRGLAPPPGVLDAGKTYIDDEDIVGQWIEDCCAIEPARFCRAADLFSSWSAYAEAHGHDKGSSKSLGDALSARGYASARKHGARVRLGISIKTGGTS